MQRLSSWLDQLPLPHRRGRAADASLASSRPSRAKTSRSAAPAVRLGAPERLPPPRDAPPPVPMSASAYGGEMWEPRLSRANTRLQEGMRMSGSLSQAATRQVKQAISKVLSVIVKKIIINSNYRRSVPIHGSPVPPFVPVPTAQLPDCPWPPRWVGYDQLHHIKYGQISTAKL